MISYHNDSSVENDVNITVSDLEFVDLCFFTRFQINLIKMFQMFGVRCFKSLQPIKSKVESCYNLHR